ncbi:Predicted ATPase [Nonomuraea solani]|uniref:Predicted ATPase n=1 Tax=Nonomuraea solani TaxID=1144553 RepID=A0A1H6ECT6_9ACTN|nr:helix-turn-helix domain-containing protein [Nonomuraea solani]SEG95607.1 Predicted ATPase [Nonomuraea solani]
MEEPALSVLLRGWRERALLSQEQLAARAGLSARTIRRLETGELRRPRSASIRLLAQALDLAAAELSILVRAAGTDTHDPRPERSALRQLPADVAAFVGRARELTLLEEAGDAATVVITAIDGMAGVGKTALAVHAAHQLACRFPDGDLFVDLHGYTQGMAVAEPADTLARMLGVLGVPGESIPHHLDDRAALYRSLLSDKKMLIVLDNAADEAQVRPLLPGRGGCLVLITSRRRLIGLDGALTLSVDVMPPADAIALFTGTAGQERVAGTPREMLAEVVRRCGLLPLAIRLAAARLKAHPAWTVDHLLERLEEHESRLGELHAGQRSITAALDLSYRELAIAEQRAYRFLGLHAGPDIAPDAAAALLDTTVGQASTLLDQLLEVHLLQEPISGRYRFHDLIRTHATALTTEEESETERRAALTRLLDHYSQAASAAMDRLYPYEADMRPRPPSGIVSMPDEAAATTWLEAELSNLLALAQHAAEHDFPEHIRHLSTTLHRCLRTRGRYAEAETLHRQALSAARAAADRLGEMEALIALGEIRHMQNRYETAIEDTSYALEIARAIGRRPGELRALNTLGMLRAVHGQYVQSGENFTKALNIARAVGHRTGELDALIGSGHIHRLMGRHEQAVDNLTRALDIAGTIGHRTGEARALLGLGHIHLGRDEHEAATDCFTRAGDLARGTEHRLGELDSLTALGDLHRVQGRHEQARTCYQRALDLAREIGNRNWEFEAVHGMGRLQHDAGHADQALDSHRQALRLATDLDQPGDQTRAHDGLAHAHAALGRHDQARHHWTQALSIMTTLGTDHTDEQGVDVASVRVHLARLTAVNSGESPAPREPGPGSG